MRHPQTKASDTVTLTLRLLAGAAMLYLLIALAVFALQRRLQYFPGTTGTLPQATGLHGVVVIPLIAADGIASTLWYAPAQPGQPTLLYFQGNGGELSDRADRFAFYQSLGLGVAFLSYRGYGASRDAISEAGLIADATAAYDWLAAQNIPPQHIALVGESLGTGVAVQLAAKRTVGAVTLEAPYTATVDIAAQLYWWLPVHLLMKDQYRSIDHIAQIHAPLLIQHGTADQTIPFASGQRLFAAAAEPKTFIPLPDQGHEALYQPQTWAREADFFSQTLRRPPQ